MEQVYTPPARGLLKRVIDRVCKRPPWEAPVPYPIIVIAVVPTKSAPRQVTYDEGLVFSDRLSAIFYETSFPKFSHDRLEELVHRCILFKSKQAEQAVKSVKSN